MAKNPKDELLRLFMRLLVDVVQREVDRRAARPRTEPKPMPPREAVH